MRVRATRTALVLVAGCAAAAACDRFAGVRELIHEPPDAADVVQIVEEAGTDATEEQDETGPWSAITPGASPARILVDDAYLYWITNESPDGGEIVKMPLDGGARTTLATNEPTPSDFALDDAYVYVTSGGAFGDGLVKRVRKDGTEEIVVASGLTAPRGVAADDAALYWVDLGDGGTTTITGRVVAADKDGGRGRDLVNGLVLPSNLTYDDAYLYFTTLGLSNCDGTGQATGTVERIARDGGGRATLATDQDCPTAIFVHDTRVFWTNTSTDHGTVSVTAKTPDGGVTVLATSQPLPASVTSDGTHVFWANAVVPNGTVLACAIASCSGTKTELGKGLLGPVSMAIDRSYLYWATLGVASEPGKIQRYPLAQVP